MLQFLIPYVFSPPVVQQFQEYADPEEVGEENKRRSGAGLKDEEKVLLPLEEDVLGDNLGLPMVVVLTKVIRWSSRGWAIHLFSCSLRPSLHRPSFI